MVSDGEDSLTSLPFIYVFVVHRLLMHLFEIKIQEASNSKQCDCHIATIQFKGSSFLLVKLWIMHKRKPVKEKKYATCGGVFFFLMKMSWAFKYFLLFAFFILPWLNCVFIMFIQLTLIFLVLIWSWCLFWSPLLFWFICCKLIYLSKIISRYNILPRNPFLMVCLWLSDISFLWV